MTYPLDLIQQNPLILGGQPVIKGTRFPVSRLLALIGMNYLLEDIKKEYPYLKITKKELVKILAFYQKRINWRHTQRKVSKHPQKFRLLLDVAFSDPYNFPKTYLRTNLKHSIIDFKLSPQASDEEIYQIACQDGRFVVTINFRHFKNIVKPKCPGIIAIPSELTNKQIDEILVKFVSGKNPLHYYGKPIKL